MRRKLSTQILICYFICSVCVGKLVPFAHTQTLTEIYRNQEFRDVTRTNAKKLPFPSWLNPKSNYVDLLTSMPSENFFKKFINLQDGIIRSKPARHKSIEYIGFSSEFFKKIRRDPIEMLVYMPHPAVFDLAENETLPSLLNFLPKQSTITETSIINVVEYKANIHQLNDGSFVIIVKLPMQVRIFIRSKQQIYLTDATELLLHANMKWLVEQLSS